MRRVFVIIAVALVFVMSNVAPVIAAEYFDTTDIDQGLIHVTYSDGGKLKLIIEKDSKKYTYDVNSAGQQESFPLQLGNGEYKISLLKNTSGSNYRLLGSKLVTVKLTDPNLVYLKSIQNVNWSVDSKAVAKAVELTKDVDDLEKKAKLLWDYMVKNNSYDYQKLSTLKSGYIPVIDQTLEVKKGICYDFTSLYAAMLRSQGTPAKLIKGYAPKNASGYHSWNEVYDASQKKWIVIDTTYDIQMAARKASLFMVKSGENYNNVYEY